MTDALEIALILATVAALGFGVWALITAGPSR